MSASYPHSYIAFEAATFRHQSNLPCHIFQVSNWRSVLIFYCAYYDLACGTQLPGAIQYTENTVYNKL